MYTCAAAKQRGEVMSKHPKQPLVWDGPVIRFKANKIVEYLLEKGGIDMNDISKNDFSKADRRQFAQLIGYSVSGYGGLSYVGCRRAGKADAKADNFAARQ